MITAKGKQIDWHPGMTVRQVLKIIGYDFCNSLVRVNRRIIPPEKWDLQPVPDGAVLEVHQIMSGG